MQKIVKIYPCLWYYLGQVRRRSLGLVLSQMKSYQYLISLSRFGMMELKLHIRIRSPAVQKLTSFSVWKPWEAHDCRPRASQGFQAEKPVSVCMGGTALFYFTTLKKKGIILTIFHTFFVVLP